MQCRSGDRTIIGQIDYQLHSINDDSLGASVNSERKYLPESSASRPNGLLAMSRFLLVAAAIGIGFFGLPSHAAAKYSSIVVDARTGQVLYARQADTLRYPASLTKIMTLYLAFEALDAKRLSLNSRIRVSAQAARQPPSKFGLRKGQTISVGDAIMGLVTKSANDAAVALAEHIAGSEASFARRMTVKARELGMTRTTFRNASGLPNRQQRSTARDMVALGRAIIRNFPQYYSYFSKTSFTYKGQKYRNHNRLLGRYEGTDGIKTGYIHASGYNLVASVSRDGQRLIGVVFGGKTARSRDAHMRKIVDKSFLRLAKYVGRSVAPVPKHKPPRNSPAKQTMKGWRVQVGAFDTYSAAEKNATAAAEAVSVLFHGAGVSIVPVVQVSARLYRAQLTTLNAESAQQACKLLKIKRFECVAISPNGEQVSLSTKPG